MKKQIVILAIVAVVAVIGLLQLFHGVAYAKPGFCNQDHYCNSCPYGPCDSRCSCTCEDAAHTVYSCAQYCAGYCAQ
ncbi:MAG: hypothetical protein HY033_09275 [Ignavibacteriae bacterium]|nr:hypothetical protein [Ignavibacteriota bacterium]